MKILYCVTLRMQVICAAEQYFETTKRLIPLKSECCYPSFNCLEWPPSFKKLVQGVSVVCCWINLGQESCGGRAELLSGPRRKFQMLRPWAVALIWFPTPSVAACCVLWCGRWQSSYTGQTNKCLWFDSENPQDRLYPHGLISALPAEQLWNFSRLYCVFCR